MRILMSLLTVCISVGLFNAEVLADAADEGDRVEGLEKAAVHLGPRPFYLIDEMTDSELKKEMQGCRNGPFHKSEFSIGHRGAAMQFPEHTRESYLAAARMGAGVLECDVTFTKDKQLVCRHSQCDLHATTNILTIPELAAKCSVPFSPAVKDPVTGALIQPAYAQCCTSDITVDEFKRLKGKMDGFNPAADTVQEYMAGTPSFRTDLYAAHGTVMTHAESIALFKQLKVKMTPELKEASVAMPFDGYNQQDYAQQMINEYKAAGVPARNVLAQSFNLDDILYWIEHERAFGAQAVYLDDIDNVSEGYPALSDLEALHARGVNIIAPPMWALLNLDARQRIVPSDYAINAKHAGLEIITWTLERSGHLSTGGGWYYQSTTPVIRYEGQTLEVLDVLARQVGIRGIFSDWPATVTYYANCTGLK